MFSIGYLPIIIVIAIVIVAVKLMITVPQGYEYTLEKFGRYKRTMEPGLHFIMPFFEQIGRKINMMEQVLDVQRQEVISKDNAMLGVDAVVFYQVLDAAKAAYEVDNLRQAVILKAEGEKQSVVLSAEGRKEAAFRDAEARERSAEAEARATEMVSKAISEGNTNALNYFVALKYIESLKAFAESPNQKVFFMPVEATAVLSSLGGIAELAKDAMQNKPLVRTGVPTGAPR